MAEANVRLRVDGRDAVNQLNRVNKAAGTLKGTVGKLVGAFAGIQAAKFVFFKTAELETQTRSLKVLTGSLGNAQKIIKELQQFGAVTPFTSAELIETAKRLKAFGFETEKIVDVTKRLGDIAGATGADLGGIATAFGQIQAKGRLQGEELLQLQERGVDLQGTLRKEYDLTAEQFQKALSKGQIGADAVTFALEKLTEKGGKYANGAIAQSDTLSGKLSTLVDGIDTIARALGEVLAPSLKNVFDLAIDTVNAINQAMAAGSITDRQKQGFQQEAVREVQAAGGGFGVGKVVVRHLGKTYQGPPDQVIRQITNDLINKEVQKRAGSQVLAASTANAAATVVNRPALGTGNGTGGSTRGGGAGSRATQRVDMSQELFDLNKRLLGQGDALTESERIVLNFQIEKQRIAEASLLPREEEIKLLEAAAGFEQEILERREDQQRLINEANKKAADEAKRQQRAEQRRLEADPGFQMQKQLETLIDTQNQVAFAAQSMGGAFSNAFGDVVTGAKTGQEALSGMLKSIASDFLGMAQKIIAQQLAMILYGTIMKALGVSMPGGGGMGGGNYFDPKTGLGVAGPNFGKANGGPVSGGQPYMVGERGPELFVPGQSGGVMRNEDMRSLMGRSPASGGAASMNFSFETTSIGGTEYVSREQLESAMAVTRKQASNDGAKRGMNMTLDKMQNSPRTRTRIGLR